MDFLTNYTLHIIPSIISIFIFLWFVGLIIPIVKKKLEEQGKTLNVVYNRKAKIKTFIFLFVASSIVFLLNGSYTYKNETYKPTQRPVIQTHKNKSIDSSEVRKNQTLDSRELREHNQDRFNWRNKE